MNQDIDLNGHDEVFLQMELKKSSLKRGKDGNFIFDVEASNENLDFEGQRVLQMALLGSKDYFLSNGVVSKDHLHQKVDAKGVRFDEEYIIGEPIDVYTDGASTRVRGKLYASNPHAQKFIRLLEDGSTRVKASVGGLVPKVVNKVGDAGRKVGEVVSVLWNDLALTIAPVNPTVSPAVMVKSLSSLEFVKSLQAGYGTDAASFTGGRALQGEDVEDETVERQVNTEEAIESLVGAITDGEIEDSEEAEEYLVGFGIEKAIARDVIEAVVKNSTHFREVLPMAKGKLWDEVVGRMQKAFGKKPDDDEDPDELDQGGGDDGDEDDEDIEDATPVVKAMAEKIGELSETIETMAKSQAALMEQMTQSVTMQKSMGEGLLAIMSRTEEIAQTPAPRKGAVTALEAAMAKGGFGGGTQEMAGGGLKHKQFTPAMKDACMDVLTKAVKDGELSILECGKIETQINKSLNNPAFQLDQKYVQLLQSKMGK